jgi:hypothetical protein
VGVNEITIEEQLNNLDTRIQIFVRCIDSLPEAFFLKKMDKHWAPRDVLAHLIGWNRYTIEGCQQMRRGETPFYFIDPGDDFSKVNAMSVRKYGSKNRRKLVNELEASAQELRQFLLSVDAREWEADYGVRYKGGLVTIRNTVDALMSDYIHHRQQIKEWAKRVEERRSLSS